MKPGLGYHNVFGSLGPYQGRPDRNSALHMLSRTHWFKFPVMCSFHSMPTIPGVLQVVWTTFVCFTASPGTKNFQPTKPNIVCLNRFLWAFCCVKKLYWYQKSQFYEESKFKFGHFKRILILTLGIFLERLQKKFWFDSLTFYFFEKIT